MNDSVRWAYVTLITASVVLIGFLMEKTIDALVLSMALLFSMIAIGLIVDCLHVDVKKNQEMLKQIHEKLGIKEEEKK